MFFNLSFAQIPIEELGARLGTKPIKIIMFYVAIVIIGISIYLIIEYQDKKEREKVLKVLKPLAFIHQICPFCVIARKYPWTKFSKLVRLWGKICPFCNIYRVVKRGGSE